MYLVDSWRRSKGAVRGFDLDFTNPVGIGGVLDVCLGCGGVGNVGVEWIRGLYQDLWRGDVVLCLCEL